MDEVKRETILECAKILVVDCDFEEPCNYRDFVGYMIEHCNDYCEENCKSHCVTDCWEQFLTAKIKEGGKF